MKMISILAIFLFMGQTSWAQIRDYQTTRLLSTSGAGVASILTTEAAILNPASSAFFNENTASLHLNQVGLDKKSPERSEKFPKNARSQGYFVSDNDGPVKGGMAYIQQKENHFERERISMHAASLLNKRTSFGLNYQYVQDTFPKSYRSQTRDFSHVLNAGLTYVLLSDLTVGVVARDLTASLVDDQRATVGLQYTLSEKINLLFDYGFIYKRAVNKNFSWAAATQFSLFKDFFVRGGLFEDQLQQFKGYSWGASWVGPRLGIEIAQRYSEQSGKTNYILKGEKIIDTALSVFITF